ncbi:cupin domain-containing protein [Actinomadura barringtoniae]|uniref:Cupin domain-containing protein n=1 Tax=Actinomadura barringtoniae TaxID=1427535 RepID=A0A939PHQ5_9ACTN|nr:cupin domain-containing protein [Actinomadura barringtoniae]MBO2448756.1 cupin domain-containing protein [Actinomadura barringtoniae]
MTLQLSVVRRVVTGLRNGTSVIVSDEPVAPISVAALPGTEFTLLWGVDGVPVVGSETGADEPAFDPYFPERGGTRLVLVRWPPDTTPPPEGDPQALAAEAEKRLPGSFSAIGDAHGLHLTDTVDWCLVLDGEMWLTLDDGSETRLTTGSCLVQRGTRHAWHNRTDRDVLLLFVLLGADRVP